MTDAASRNHILRHLLATLAYRATRAIQGMPAEFGALEPGQGARTPTQLVAHIADLLELTRGHVAGEEWRRREEGGDLLWGDEVDRFYAAMGALDRLLADMDDLRRDTEDRLIQGPLADALTHAGQLAMLRRLAGDPVPGESYAMADIRIGQVGPDQPEPRRRMG